MRRATIDTSKDIIKTANFYPRSPCGERPTDFLAFAPQADFYPRSPCGERRILAHDGRKVVKFLSTLSLRRATTEPIENEVEAHISIHALLAESDELHASSAKSRWRFLSTLSLRRATQPKPARNNQHNVFLSTLSLRRATGGGHISKTRRKNFYPRSPCGERRGPFGSGILMILFLSTLSLRRATGVLCIT